MNDKRNEDIVKGIKESQKYKELMSGELVPLEPEELLYYVRLQTKLDIDTLSIQKGLTFYWCFIEEKRAR